MIARLAKWLFVEAKHFWLCLVVCAVAFAAVYSLGATEQAIRIAGLLLQLAGILTVVWGIVTTRQFFEMPSPTKVFKDWLARFPLRRPQAISGTATVTLAGEAVAAHGYTSWVDDPSLPLEERVLRLAKNVPLFHERIINFQAQLDSDVTQLNAAIKRESSERAEQANALNQRVVRHGTGGLHISAIGAVWLFVGAILGTASQELARWVR